nr:flagellar filament capping protein FliD [Massilia sp. TS11]
MDVNSIVAKLMQVESQPLTQLDKKATDIQAKLSAYGTLKGALSSFQSAMQNLASPAAFQSVAATSSNTDTLSGTATTQAVAGNYAINVTQLAQAQTLASRGVVSTSAAIGVGTSTVVSFQLGSISGGVFGQAGTTLANSVASSGIATGALSINGTTIDTSAATKSARLLADAINAKSVSSGVTAKVQAATSGATLFSGFGDIDTSGGGSYSLSVGGVQLASQAGGVAAGAGITAASLDAILAGSNATTQALTDAGISFSGSAAAGTLQFTAADGSNITLSESVSGSVNGGIGTDSASANTGSSRLFMGAVTLASATATPITIGGGNPALAGFTAGTAGSYIGASYAQDGSQISGSITIDSSNNNLAGIRDAINKANIGITATIISDGSATPNHLVLTSNKTGANAAIRISVSGSGGNPADPAIESLLAYDPGGAQNLTQNTAAQSTALTVNGIPVTSSSTSVNGAIQGVTLNVSKTGSANLNVAVDTKSITSNVGNFVKAYNDLNAQIKNLTGYDADTKKGGVLLGDSTVQSVQSSVRRALTTAITGGAGNLSNLSQVGVSFQKDGSLTLDTGKLNTAISKNFKDIASLFAAIGSATDSLVNYTSSSAATKPGSYAINVSHLATAASITSENPLAASTTIAADTVWNVTLNDSTPSVASNTAQVTIPQGTYTASQLATLLQSAINGASNFSGSGTTVTATIDSSGKLVLATSKFGSVTNLALSGVSGSAVSDLFGSATPVAGTDVAGTIDGAAVTGSGQFLTGAAGSGAEGLKIEITGGSTGDRGFINFSQGYAHQIGSLLDGFLSTDGFINSKTDGLNKSIKDINKQKDSFNDKLADIEKRYRAQYTALDTSIASLNKTASFLTQQFAALSKSSG